MARMNRTANGEPNGFEGTKFALEREDVTGSNKWVLVATASFMPVCRASEATLARIAGVSTRTAGTSLKWLEKNGFIERVSRGKNRPKRVFILWQKPDLVREARLVKLAEEEEYIAADEGCVPAKFAVPDTNSVPPTTEFAQGASNLRKKPTEIADEQTLDQIPTNPLRKPNNNCAVVNNRAPVTAFLKERKEAVIETEIIDDGSFEIKEEIFDEFLKALGLEPGGMTHSAQGAAKRAFKEIRTAEKGALDIAEIQTRVRNYRLDFKGCALTASALAKHWPGLADNPTRKQVGGQISQDFSDWIDA